ncbi:hypothetical protein [Mycetohabitans sp. B46]|uniref:hypothetical protein n=1 Tax=Mycetohabitans sp. B46 TaxID=2772536 RepID=UPI00307FC51A
MRSHLLSEALTNPFGGRFVAYLAGSHPKGEMNPLALRALARWCLSTDGYRSKSGDEIIGDGVPTMRIASTVCDSVASQTCHTGPAVRSKRIGVTPMRRAVQ